MLTLVGFHRIMGLKGKLFFYILLCDTHLGTKGLANGLRQQTFKQPEVAIKHRNEDVPGQRKREGFH